MKHSKLHVRIATKTAEHPKRFMLASFLLIVFCLIGVVILTSRFLSVVQFASTQHVFLVREVFLVDAATLLSERFMCTNSDMVCKSYPYVFIGAILVYELFLAMAVVFILQKAGRIKRIAFIVLQQWLPIMMVIGTILIPYAVTEYLASQSAAKIKTAVLKLHSDIQKTSDTIISDPVQIQKALGTNQEYEYYEYQVQQEAVLRYVGIGHTTPDTFSRSILMPRYVYSSDFSSLANTLAFDILYFSDEPHVLLIGSVTQPLIETLAPVIAQTLVKRSFPTLTSWKKREPEFQVLPEASYNDVLKKKEREIKDEYTSAIKTLETGIQEIDTFIPNLMNTVQKIEGTYRAYEDRSKLWIIECEKQEGAGSSVCTEGKKTIEEHLTAMRSQKVAIEGQVRDLTEQKNEAATSLSSWKRAYKSFQEDPITPEFQSGILEPPNSIYLKWYSDQKYPFSHYLTTAVHEYLHFQGNGHSVSKLFEEGITDYITYTLLERFLRAQKETMEFSIATGYKDLVDVVAAMRKKLMDNDFYSLYFKRNELGLSERIDAEYGEGTYKKLQSIGDQLYISSTREQTFSLLDEAIRLVSEPIASTSATP